MPCLINKHLFLICTIVFNAFSCLIVQEVFFLLLFCGKIMEFFSLFTHTLSKVWDLPTNATSSFQIYGRMTPNSGCEVSTYLGSMDAVCTQSEWLLNFVQNILLYFFCQTSCNYCQHKCPLRLP